MNPKKAFIIALGIHALALAPSYSSSCSGPQEEKKEEKKEDMKKLMANRPNMQQGGHNKITKIELIKLKKKRIANTELIFKKLKQKKCGCGSSKIKGKGKGKGKGQGRGEMLKGFREYLPKSEDYPDAPKAFIKRPHRYKSMVATDMYPGLSTMGTSLETLLWEPLDKADIRPYEIGENPIYIGKVKPPFWMDPETRQKTYDNWMELPKEEMFSRMQQMIAKFDGSHGDLAEFVRELYNTNMIRALYLLGPDDIMTDYFEESLFKAEVFNYITAHIQNEPYTRTSAELLFVLDTLYRIEVQMLQGMFDAQKRKNPKKNVRREVVDTVFMKYDEKMKQAGLDGMVKLHMAYMERRLEILDKIIERGYRVNDALFMKGRIYLTYHEDEKAYEEWKKIDPKDDGHFVFKRHYEKIRPYFDKTAKKGYSGSASSVIWLIDHNKWKFWDERGRKFIWEKDASP